MNVISFVGCMGCGKSSWTSVLTRSGYHATMEDLGRNPFLHHYWSQGDYPFHTQVSFYTHWLSQYLDASKYEKSIMDSSVISHHEVFTHHMYMEGILTESEYAVCCDLYNSVIELSDCRFIYLRCDEQELYRRIQCRNREHELNSKAYVSTLHQRLEFIASHNSHIVRSIDITSLSPSCKSDLEQFLFMLEE